jgi:hypothetical protein
LRGSRWSRAPTSANMRLPRRRFAPCHRRLGCRSRVKGGGKPFAALTVGSRGVGKRKTLSETGFPCRSRRVA